MSKQWRRWFDATTNCVDCPSGETSAPRSTGCEEPDDVWDKLVERLTAALGVLAAIGGAWTAMRDMDCFALQDMKCSEYSPVDNDDGVQRDDHDDRP